MSKPASQRSHYHGFIGVDGDGNSVIYCIHCNTYYSVSTLKYDRRGKPYCEDCRAPFSARGLDGGKNQPPKPGLFSRLFGKAGRA